MSYEKEILLSLQYARVLLLTMVSRPESRKQDERIETPCIFTAPQLFFFF